MKVAIIILETLAVPYVYDAPEPQQGNWGGEWGSPFVSVHMKVPEGLDPQCILAIRADDGEITLVQDPAKLAAKTAQAWADLRSRRNALLSSCDWVALADANLSQERKDQWFAYRQALRDLPGTLTDPTQVEWPAIP